ncbi:Uncharacterised protein [Mycobacteroides abscessus subsp. abscessus]|uniref:SdpI family protein n=1 Tax=Mycobacteroides abscessus TaxID=36809 RepID=UPI000928674A|nr:SdpI family protein [Mycobacteroides abscessus]SIE35620.1 Uncharacterised protein [Mycobacteroides abscessus subsp. abscessus]SKV16488.1 Uncharacterised protein [Mycobacteroides abscessus subsp. abscessus]
MGHALDNSNSSIGSDIGRSISKFTLIVYVLISVAYLVIVARGYQLALGNQLMPNRYFGFRNADTFASVDAWNAAQLAGFSWALFAGGAALVIGIVILGVAYVRSWPPMIHIAIAIIAPLALLGALGAAYYQANAAAADVARHVTVNTKPVI